MILTLNPNTAIDYSLRIREFEMNSTIRASDSAWGMGGKAADVSWILGKLGVPTHALGFAAGTNGVRMEGMLRERGVECDFVWVDGETRLNVIVVTPSGQSTLASSTLEVSPRHTSELMSRYERALGGTCCVVMGGSLPQGVAVDFYTEALGLAHRCNVPVIFDSSGAALREGVKCRPALIKPNLTELGELLGYVPASRDDVRKAALRLHADFGADLIVTLGAEGSIAVLGGRTYFIPPLSVPIASTAGAGDGVLAGMALAYERAQPLEYGLQHGFALAAAILGTLATADFRVDQYLELLPQVRLLPL